MKLNTGITIVAALNLLLTGCGRDTSTWESAVKCNTIAGYEHYIALYPNGSHAQSAHESIARIAWNTAIIENTTASISAYIKKFPNAGDSEKATQRLKLLKGLDILEVCIALRHHRLIEECSYAGDPPEYTKELKDKFTTYGSVKFSDNLLYPASGISSVGGGEAIIEPLEFSAEFEGISYNYKLDGGHRLDTAGVHFKDGFSIKINNTTIQRENGSWKILEIPGLPHS